MSGNSNAPDGEVLIKIVKETLKKLTKAELIEIELYQENIEEEIHDVNAEPYTKIPFDKVPKNCKLKLHMVIRQPETGREITSVVSTSCNGGTFHHTDKIETTELDTVPNDADPNKNVKTDKIDKVIDNMMRVVQVVISLFNALRNAGYIKG